MSSREDIFIREFVVGFGFLGGLFTRVGVDPEEEILKALLEVAKSFSPSMGPIFPVLLFLFTALLTISSILGAYRLGGIIGLIAVAFAWMGGFIMVGGSSTESIIGIALLIVAMIIGGSAPE